MNGRGRRSRIDKAITAVGVSSHYSFHYQFTTVCGLDYTFIIAFALDARRLVSTRS